MQPSSKSQLWTESHFSRHRRPSRMLRFREAFPEIAPKLKVFQSDRLRDKRLSSQFLVHVAVARFNTCCEFQCYGASPRFRLAPAYDARRMDVSGALQWKREQIITRAGG